MIKALALGADFVFVGRPFNYAATVGGYAGVIRASQILKKEVDNAMGLLGITAPDQVERGHVAIADDTLVKF